MKNLLIFVAGGCVGCAASWFYFKNKYESISKEEIESVKKTFTVPKKTVKKQVEVEKPEEAKKETEMEEYMSKVNYTKFNKFHKVDNVDESKNKPYVIEPEEFGMEDYETISLVYYADGYLCTSDTDEQIEDADSKIGLGNLRYIGKYEPDAVHIRNEKLKTDYEVLKDLDNWPGREEENY